MNEALTREDLVRAFEEMRKPQMKHRTDICSYCSAPENKHFYWCAVAHIMLYYDMEVDYIKAATIGDIYSDEEIYRRIVE